MQGMFIQRNAPCVYSSTYVRLQTTPDKRIEFEMPPSTFISQLIYAKPDQGFYVIDHNGRTHTYSPSGATWTQLDMDLLQLCYSGRSATDKLLVLSRQGRVSQRLFRFQFFPITDCSFPLRRIVSQDSAFFTAVDYRHLLVVLVGSATRWVHYTRVYPLIDADGEVMDEVVAAAYLFSEEDTLTVLLTTATGDQYLWDLHHLPTKYLFHSGIPAWTSTHKQAAVRLTTGETFSIGYHSPTTLDWRHALIIPRTEAHQVYVMVDEEVPIEEVAMESQQAEQPNEVLKKKKRRPVEVG